MTSRTRRRRTAAGFLGLVLVVVVVLAVATAPGRQRTSETESVVITTSYQAAQGELAETGRVRRPVLLVLPPANPASEDNWVQYIPTQGQDSNKAVSDRLGVTEQDVFKGILNEKPAIMVKVPKSLVRLPDSPEVKNLFVPAGVFPDRSTRLELPADSPGASAPLASGLVIVVTDKAMKPADVLARWPQVVPETVRAVEVSDEGGVLKEFELRAARLPDGQSAPSKAARVALWLALVAGGMALWPVVLLIDGASLPGRRNGAQLDKATGSGTRGSQEDGVGTQDDITTPPAAPPPPDGGGNQHHTLVEIQADPALPPGDDLAADPAVNHQRPPLEPTCGCGEQDRLIADYTCLRCNTRWSHQLGEPWPDVVADSDGPVGQPGASVPGDAPSDPTERTGTR